ncbi:Gp49 family protein [Pseudomonas sp. TNT2022 ID233]|uniref:Gp49 family protein n=1 Tax=Pseudomonas aphyarum TaxID=2942629 RepID=UPI00235F6213|nr:Gp49 family protein [Pseudomonas aphyarum]MDD1141646.1 Gp49 family protein [Pseudomonas aphyarum]
MSNDQSLERRITALGLTAPRITYTQIEALVKAMSYHTYVVPGTTTTIAAAIDPTGFVVALGTSACVSPENFNEVLGRDAAISKAKTLAADELWKLEGYRLKQNLHQASKVGLIAGLELYADENIRDDLMFVGDLATGFCVASIGASPASSSASASSTTAKIAP